MSQENVEIVRRAYDAFNRGDFDMLASEFYDPQVEWQTEDPDASTHRGREAVRRYFDQWVESFEGLHADVEEYIDASNDGGQDGVQLVLCPRPRAHQLRAALQAPAQGAGPLVGAEDGGQEARVEQLAERRGVDLVGLHLRLCDRAHLPGVGDHHPPDVGLEHAFDRNRRSRCLERHLVVGRKALGEQLELGDAGLDAPARAQLLPVFDRHLA
jgi:hypothetical protein